MRTGRRISLAVCVALALVALGPGAALGAPTPLSDCNAHNALTRHYSISQLRNALATMPADIKEYSPCYQIIQNQLFAQVGGLKAHGGSAGGGGSFISTPVLIVVIVVVLAGGGLALRAARRP